MSLEGEGEFQRDHSKLLTKIISTSLKDHHRESLEFRELLCVLHSIHSDQQDVKGGSLEVRQRKLVETSNLGISR